MSFSFHFHKLSITSIKHYEMSLNSNILVDRHGFINIYKENWETSIRYHRISKNQYEIIGLSVNVLLHGLFLLHGSIQDTEIIKIAFPYQNIKCWDMIIESFYINLSILITIKELTDRIFYLRDEYVKSSQSNCVFDTSLQSPYNLLYGALMTLYIWIANFYYYISEEQIIELLQVIPSLCQLPVLDLNSNQSNGININTDDISRCKVKLSNIMSKLSNLTQSLAREQSERRHGMSTNHLILTSCPNTFPKLEIQSKQGKWKGDRNEINRSIIKELSATPVFRVDIFGGENFINQLNFDDNPNEDIETQENKKDYYYYYDDTNTKKYFSFDHPLEPRVREGTSLMQGPISFLHQDNNENITLWSFDIIEIARQITLYDSKLFTSLPMRKFLDSKLWTSPRYMHEAKEYRQLLDSFNALSSWAIWSILSESRISSRKERYENIVALSDILLNKMNNYHSSVALISALDHHCITKLTLTISLVDPHFITKLQQNKQRLAETSNYSLYRQEINELISNKCCKFHRISWRGRYDEPNPLKRNKEYLLQIQDKTIQRPMKDNIGVIPYIGVFTMDLMAIQEGNSIYLRDSPFLINIPRICLVSNCISTMTELQHIEYVYCFEPIRLIASLFVYSLKSYMKLTSTEVKQLQDKFYKRSQELEVLEKEIRDKQQEEESMSSRSSFSTTKSKTEFEEKGIDDYESSVLNSKTSHKSRFPTFTWRSRSNDNSIKNKASSK